MTQSINSGLSWIGWARGGVVGGWKSTGGSSRQCQLDWVTVAAKTNRPRLPARPEGNNTAEAASTATHCSVSKPARVRHTVRQKRCNMLPELWLSFTGHTKSCAFNLDFDVLSVIYTWQGYRTCCECLLDPPQSPNSGTSWHNLWGDVQKQNKLL